MPEAGDGEAYEQRLGSILDELTLGTRWERPSLILAVYRSEIIKDKAQQILYQSLKRAAIPLCHYRVDRAHYDIPIDLRDHPGHEQAVYFVEGLSCGGGRGYSNAYRALNMHREYLVDGKVRAVFWLTRVEARQLPRFAPDFWAFRHKVVEFFDLPAEKEKPAGSRSYPLYPNASQELQNKIRDAERLLALGCPEEALQELRQVLRASAQESGLCLRIAEVLLSMGQAQAARRMLKKAKMSATEQPDLKKELERFDRALRAFQPPQGGFQERFTGEK